MPPRKYSARAIDNRRHIVYNQYSQFGRSENEYPLIQPIGQSPVRADIRPDKDADPRRQPERGRAAAHDTRAGEGSADQRHHHFPRLFRPRTGRVYLFRRGQGHFRRRAQPGLRAGAQPRRIGGTHRAGGGNRRSVRDGRRGICRTCENRLPEAKKC